MSAQHEIAHIIADPERSPAQYAEGMLMAPGGERLFRKAWEGAK